MSARRVRGGHRPAALACAAALAAALLVSRPASAESAACDTCADLCRLVDQLQQKEKGIELWRKYAASTAGSQWRPLMPWISDMDSMENQVWNEFSEWARERKQNDELPCAIPPQPPGQTEAPVAVDLLTNAGSDSCEITYKGNKLQDQVLKDYEKDTNCKVMSDATIAHEEVHREHCMRAYHQDRRTAPAILDTPENVAESELQAWTKHRDVLREAVRALAGRCGWEPTKRQKSDPNSVPSTQQTKDMQARGWKALNALKGASP